MLQAAYSFNMLTINNFTPLDGQCSLGQILFQFNINIFVVCALHLGIFGIVLIFVWGKCLHGLNGELDKKVYL